MKCTEDVLMQSRHHFARREYGTKLIHRGPWDKIPESGAGRTFEHALASQRVTCDFARQMEGATEIKCPEFGDNIIAHM